MTKNGILFFKCLMKNLKSILRNLVYAITPRTTTTLVLGLTTTTTSTTTTTTSKSTTNTKKSTPPTAHSIPSNGPIKVLLVTAHRSGSTFLGELFNQNKNAFYLFEPLGALQVTVLN